MKNLFLIITILTTAVLAGCNEKQKTSSANSGTNTSATQSNTNNSTDKSVKYVTEDKQVFILKTNDNFTTATLIDSHGYNYMLKAVPAASGMYLEGENGVSIHTKGKEGYIELPKGKTFYIKEIQ